MPARLADHGAPMPADIIGKVQGVGAAPRLNGCGPCGCRKRRPCRSGAMLIGAAKISSGVLGLAVTVLRDAITCGSVNRAGAENVIRAGHAACSYSWMIPPEAVTSAYGEMRDLVLFRQRFPAVAAVVGRWRCPGGAGGRCDAVRIRAGRA